MRKDLIDGRYRIIRRLGSGATGTVYLIVNEKVGKRWAMKEIPIENPLGTTFARMSLEAEIMVLKGLEHPNLPAIIDVVQEETCFYLIMEYIEGKSIKEGLKGKHAFTQGELLAYSISLCEAIEYLHKRQPPIIHKDIKPANVMIREDGSLVLIDFGCADLSGRRNPGEQNSCQFGTPYYAPPEQYDPNAVPDQRSDIYAFGRTLQYMLLAPLSYEKRKLEEISAEEILLAYEQLYGSSYIPEENIVKDLCCIIQKATQENADERYQTIGQVKSALLSCQAKTRRNRINRQLPLLLFCFLLTLLSGIFSWVGEAQQKHYQYAAYQALLEKAEEASDQKERIPCYEQAILTDPVNETAYLKLLDLYLEDDHFSDHEKNALLHICNERQGRSAKSNLERLKLSEAGYSDFCYRVGIALFFQYEGLAGKSLSKNWFERALSEGACMKKERRTRVEIYAGISEYYDSLMKNTPRDTGEEKDESDYFYDLCQLNRTEWEDLQDNIYASCLLYNEIATQLASHVRAFLYTQKIAPEHMQEEIHRIERRIPKMETAATKEEEAMVRNLKENLSHAASCIEAAVMEWEHTEVSG